MYGTIAKITASPEQHEHFVELRALLTADPEWHDGDIVDNQVP
jgi:hypothetical protein